MALLSAAAFRARLADQSTDGLALSCNCILNFVFGGLEGKAIGNLLFGGEHTSSFYEWQGFMEGAALSGLRTAGEVLALAKA